MLEYGIGYSTPALDLIEGEPEWEVDTILAARCFGQCHQLQYLVKWVGYPESENSWEPAEHLQAPDLIEEFHRTCPSEVKSIKADRASLIQEKPQPPSRCPALYKQLLPCLKHPPILPSLTLCTLATTVSMQTPLLSSLPLTLMHYPMGW